MARFPVRMLVVWCPVTSGSWPSSVARPYHSEYFRPSDAVSSEPLVTL